MRKYVTDPLPMLSYIDELVKMGKYIKPSFPIEVQEQKELEYELYALNIHQEIYGGHFISIARNREDWLEYDDYNVQKVK
jgi:ubiquitin C-terminal hydrolase